MYKLLLPIFVIVIVNTLGNAATLIPKDQSLSPFDLTDYNIHITIKDNLAYTVITQVYNNPSERELEGMYIFPTPEGAKITEFSMWIAGKKMVGTVVERIKARRIYQSIVDSRRDPGILEQEKRNVFKVRVFPILPKSQQKFRIAYTQRVAFADSHYNYSYPLAEDSEYPSGLAKIFNVKVDIKSQQELGDIQVDGVQKWRIVDKNEYSAHITAISHKARFDRDFTVTFTYKEQKAIELCAAKNHLALTLTHANKGKKVALNTLVVIDTSASMAKNSYLQQIKLGVNEWLEQLSTDDHFSVLAFNSQVDVMSQTLLAATSKNKEKAREFLKQQTPLGASNISLVLQKIQFFANVENVIFISDGLATLSRLSEEKLAAEIKQKPNLPVFFTLAVGSKAEQSFMANLAKDTKGWNQQVKNASEFPNVIRHLYTKMAYSPLKELQITAKGPKPIEFYPITPSNLYLGEQICLFGKYPQRGKYHIEITAKKDGITWQQKRTIDISSSTKKDIWFEQHWEYQRIDHLLEKIRKEGENKELVEEVIQLAIKNQVVTPYTAYLVLESEKDYKKYGIDRSQLNRLAEEINSTTDRVYNQEELATAQNYSAPEPAEWLLFILLGLAICMYWRKQQKLQST